jgi:hypothetical protein
VGGAQKHSSLIEVPEDLIGHSGPDLNLPRRRLLTNNPGVGLGPGEGLSAVLQAPTAHPLPVSLNSLVVFLVFLRSLLTWNALTLARG